MLPRIGSQQAPSAPTASAAGTRAPSPAASPPPGVFPHLVDFFDRDQNGYITLSESIGGFERLGIGKLAATAFGTAVNGGLGALMGANPFALPIAKIPRGKHASDTDIIDARGNLDEARLEATIQKYFGSKGELGLPGLTRMLADDFFRDFGLGSAVGVAAATGELGLLLYLGGEWKNGAYVLEADRFRAFYKDPNVFHDLEHRQEALRRERDASLGGRVVNLFHELIF